MESKTERAPWMLGMCGDYTERDQQNVQRFIAAVLGWSVAFAVATFLLRYNRDSLGVLAYAVAVIPTLLGMVAISAYVKFVRDADELVRRVHLEALAVGFGVGMLFMMGYRLFERVGAPKLDMNDPLLVMTFAWTAWQIIAARRYQ